MFSSRRQRQRAILAALAALLAYGYARFLFLSTATGGASGDGPVAVASYGYLIPASFWIARTIMEIGERQARLGGEEKRVSALFGDIRGFTTMSEGMTPAYCWIPWTVTSRAS